MPNTPPESVDKGKRRAPEASERTPLLVSSSRLPSEEAGHPADSQSRWALRRKLTTVFFISLAICLFLFALIGVLAWSYISKVSGLNPDDVIQHNLLFSGPDKVQVVNVSQAGMWLNVEGRIGVDAGKAIGVGSDKGDNILDYLWKAIGQRGVQILDRVTVNMTTIRIVPEYDPTETLLDLEVPPIELPLSVDPPDDDQLAWLTPISARIFLRPTTNRTVLLRFLKESWRRGAVLVRVHVDQAYIRGGTLQEPDWRSFFSKKLSNVRTIISMKLPSIPGFPIPGHNAPFPSIANLVTLTSISVSSKSDSLSLNGTATAINPVPYNLDFTAPSLPFDVSILDSSNPAVPAAHVASVSTLPFTLTHPNITLSVQGKVTSISASALPLLSKFMSRYLSGLSNNILISSSLAPSFQAEAIFPAPYPRPNVLRNVTIKDMKIKPKGTSFFASGTVHARAVLPKGMNVGLDVFLVFPDVLVFDGEVPSDLNVDRPSVPPTAPLPDPLPQHAFGHILPNDWVPSVSIPFEPDGYEDGSAYAVSAVFEDVPLEVLPGRQNEFSHFVRKVIFGSAGATAGIMGTVAVAVDVDGIPKGDTRDTNLVLVGLPFQGRVHVGKKGLLGFDDDDDDDEPHNGDGARERWKNTWKEILRKIREKLPHF